MERRRVETLESLCPSNLARPNKNPKSPKIRWRAAGKPDDQREQQAKSQ